MASVIGLYAEKEGRISELPRDIIDNIFDRLRTRDAARTAILSKKWRYIWASYPQLVFDYNFFEEIYRKHKEFSRNKFPNAINKALLIHSGPILKFTLHIPSITHVLSPKIDQWILKFIHHVHHIHSFPNFQSPEIDKWMLFLSSDEIKELELCCLDPTPYIVPSCIFSCSSLLDLSLRNCTLKPPYEFEDIRYLNSLILVEVSVSSSTLLQNPSPENLAIICCTDIEHRNIYAPRLGEFYLIKSGKVDWQWFASNKQLIRMHIELDTEVQNVEETMNMLKFLEDIPKVEMLLLDGFSLKYLATSNPHEVFQHQNLIHSFITYLLLRDFGVDDLDQISCALCPNLRVLDLEISVSTNKVKEPAITEYLESSNCMDLSLNVLEMVNIRYMKGIKAEPLILKLFLPLYMPREDNHSTQ